MKISRFIKNAAVITLTALILRVAGMVLRVYLANAIGSEGMGLYQLIVTIYLLVSTFANSGFAVAVTRLISEGAGSSRKIVRRATAITLSIAFLSMAVLWVFGDFIAVTFLKDIRASLSLKILSFSLPAMAINHNIRGYFIAKGSVKEQSFAQLIEQAVRLVIIFIVLPQAIPFGVEYSCGAVLLGDVVAEGVACLYIYVCYKKARSFPIKEKVMKGVVKKIFLIATPITAGRYLTTLLRSAENLMVPSQLTKYNSSRSLSLSQFGDLKGLALPLIFFPASFLSAVSTLLLPELSSAGAEGNSLLIKKTTEKTMSFTLVSSIFIATGFFVFADDISIAVYGSQSVCYYLKWLSPLIPLMYLESVTAGIMQGLNQQTRSFIYNLCDAVTRIILIVILLPRFGMNGFMAVMVISNILTSCLTLIRLIKVSEVKFLIFDWVIKPLALSVTSVLSAKMLINHSPFHPTVILVLRLFISVVVFIALLSLFTKEKITLPQRQLVRKGQK